MIDPFKVDRPILFEQVVEPNAGLRREFKRLADGILSLVLVSVVVNNPGADLRVGDQLCSGLDKIIAKQSRYPPVIATRSLVDTGVGNLKNSLKIPAE